MGIFSPYILGLSGGAFLWALILLGISSSIFKKQKRRYVQAVVFIVGGTLCTILYSYGGADGGSPDWKGAAYLFAIPFGIAGIIYGLIGKFLENSNRKTSPIVTFLVLIVLIAIMLLGTWNNNVRKEYADFDIEKAAKTDPKLTGLLALKETMPAIYAELMEELKASETPLGGYKGLDNVFTRFFERHRMSFLRNAGDASVYKYAKLIPQQLEDLKASSPNRCVHLALGNPIPDISQYLREETLLDISNVLSDTLLSVGQESSGVAGHTEVENDHIRSLQILAAQSPQSFFAWEEVASNALSNDYTKSDCQAFIDYYQAGLTAPIETITRVYRSNALSDPDSSLSLEAESRLLDVSLLAVAVDANKSLPMQLDSATVFERMSYSSPFTKYEYIVDSKLATNEGVRQNVERKIINDFCTSTDLRAILQEGRGYKFVYFLQQQQTELVLMIDEHACVNDRLNVIKK